MIDRKLKWFSRNQQTVMMGGKRNAEILHGDVNGNDEVRGDDTFLPSSFHGGPRHLKSLANNALTVVSELGATTFFITGTEI
jgi:hypothetical protein